MYQELQNESNILLKILTPEAMNIQIIWIYS